MIFFMVLTKNEDLEIIKNSNLKSIDMYKRYLLLFLILLMGFGSLHAQLHLRVASFDYLATDLTKVTKIDPGSGDPYALIKVTSDNPEDDLRAYRFDFNLLAHETEMHDGELWLYVQKNAKVVTIKRDGYNTINRQNLGYTLESGKVYRMTLSAQAPVVRTQMLMIQVTPANSKAVVMIQREGGGQKELLGTVDETGAIAKSLEYGNYTYEIVAENFHPTEGRIVLNNQNETYTETVALRSNGAEVTLRVDGNAEIWVNNAKKANGSWTGVLKAGTYTVECRQQYHRNSSQTITVKEGQSQTFTLTAPTPITGILALTSTPLGAKITIDGKDYGTTPRNITDLVIGSHIVTLTREGYYETKQTVEVKEGETSQINIPLNKVPDNSIVEHSNSDVLTFEVKGVTFKMIKVEAGTFQMGSSSGDSDEKPVHQVTLPQDYYMGETEVTQALWYAVMGQSPTSDGSKWTSSYGLGDNYPAYYISYNDISSFLTKLNTLVASKLPSGMKFRFPTEAEWEYAAKGGNKSKGYTYSGSDNIGDVAWYAGNLSSSTHEVKTKAANELGIYDMSGNVWEWCYDWYGDYSSSAQTDPTGATSGSNRVLRGGCWGYYASFCRSANRSSNAPADRGSSDGVRLAL